MSKVLSLELPEQAYDALARIARRDGLTPEATAQQWLEKQLAQSSCEIDSPASVTDPIEFMRLPLEERRRILAAQAEKLAPYYEADTEWREWLTGDFIDY